METDQYISVSAVPTNHFNLQSKFKLLQTTSDFNPKSLSDLRDLLNLTHFQIKPTFFSTIKFPHEKTICGRYGFLSFSEGDDILLLQNIVNHNTLYYKNLAIGVKILTSYDSTKLLSRRYLNLSYKRQFSGNQKNISYGSLRRGQYEIGLFDVNFTRRNFLCSSENECRKVSKDILEDVKMLVGKCGL